MEHCVLEERAKVAGPVRSRKQVIAIGLSEASKKRRRVLAKKSYAEQTLTARASAMLCAMDQKPKAILLAMGANICHPV